MELEDFKHSLKRLQKCDQIWDEMQPVAGGRHCQKCNKRIVDFSRMTYTEMALFRSEQSGPTCGFYLPAQLPQYNNKIQTLPKTVGLTALLSVFSIPQVKAASKPNLHTIAMDRLSDEQAPVDYQATDTIPKAETAWVHGILQGFDSITRRRDTIYYGTVHIKGTTNGTVSDQNGAFRLKCTTKDESGLITLIISSIGYERKEITIDIKSQREMDLGIITLDPSHPIEYYVVIVKTNKWKRFWRKMTRPFRKY